MSNEANNLSKPTLKNVLKAAVEKTTSPFQIAITMNCSVGELLDMVKEEKLEDHWEKYMNGYKDFLLNWARGEKQKDLYMELLNEAGVLNSESSGNDLTLNITIDGKKDDELVIHDITKEE